MRLRRRRLDHRAVGRQVAAQHGEAVGGDERLVARQDHVAVEHFGAGDVLAERLAVDRARGQRQQVADVVQQRAQSAGVEEVLHQELARGTDVRDQRHLARDGVEAVDRQRHAGAARQRHHVHDRIGRAAQRQDRRDGIVDGRRGQEVARLQVFPHHFDDPPARFRRHPAVARIGGGNRRRAGQREAHRLGGGGHRRRRAHRHAMARASARCRPRSRATARR